MDFIQQFLPYNILQALGWAVIHSLWQAFAVALLLAAYLLAWQKNDARKRYAAGNVALGSILLSAVATFVFYLKRSDAEPAMASEVWSEDGVLLGHYHLEDGAGFFSAYFTEHLPLIVAVWGVGLVFFMLKMLGGLLFVQQLKTRMTSPLPSEWQDYVAMLCAELGIRRPVQLLESALAKTPMALGWLKPVVLLPVGAVNHLSSAQVEAILAHELAHILRHDYLLNLLQSVVEILFYFNPAVWWVSSHVRTERENCCDDIAVRLCGNSLAYAKALVSLQALQMAAPALAMPFSKNKNQLLLRIQRILQPSQNKSNVMEKLSATLLLSVAVVLLSVQANTPFGNFLSRVVADRELHPADNLAPGSPMFELAETDTVPAPNRESHIHYSEDGESIEFKMKDDEIIWLKVDGEEIPAERFPEFEERAREILANIPEPPDAPDFPDFPDMPDMPDFPDMPDVPAPPAPPSFHGYPVPAPPAPGSRTRTITTQKDRKGTTFLIETEDGGEPVEIVVEDGKKGTIIVNGQEITGLKKGDKTIILQEVPGGHFDWDGYSFHLPDLAEVPVFPIEDFHFKMPAEVWDNARLEELKARLRSGNLSQDWLLAYERSMQGFPDNDEWREHLNEEIARFSEEQARLQEEQELHRERIQEAMELGRERALENMRDVQERQMELLEKQRQQLDQERQQLQQKKRKEKL